MHIVAGINDTSELIGYLVEFILYDSVTYEKKVSYKVKSFGQARIMLVNNLFINLSDDGSTRFDVTMNDDQFLYLVKFREHAIKNAIEGIESSSSSLSKDSVTRIDLRVKVSNDKLGRADLNLLNDTGWI